MTLEVHPCGHVLPANWLPERTIRATTEHLALVLDRGERYGATVISLYLELQVPVGPVCVRLTGSQYVQLRAQIKALDGLTPEQIIALDAELHGTVGT